MLRSLSLLTIDKHAITAALQKTNVVAAAHSSSNVNGPQGTLNTTQLPTLAKFGELPQHLRIPGNFRPSSTFVADFRCFAQTLLQRNFVAEVVEHIIGPTQGTDSQPNAIERFVRGFHLTCS